jgi:ribose transport system ATP-binding protein
MTTALRIDQISKSYGSRKVLDRVSLEVKSGEIHALLGANGAGKSTLIGCLSGAVNPDSGQIIVGGIGHAALTPRQALHAGVAVIYQHFSLVPSLSAADNIFLGEELAARGVVQARRQVHLAQALLDDIGAQVNAKRPVESLTVGERQMVEIAKVMRRKPSVLILDEPTAALGHREAGLLAERLEKLRETGTIGIVYVSHLLPEIFRLADTVSVLRDGKVALQSDLQALSRVDLIAAISGPPKTTTSRDSSPPVADQPPSVDAKEPGTRISAHGMKVGAVGPLDLSAASGEVVGIFGLMGSGRTETLEAMCGIRPIESGQLRIQGRPVALKDPEAALALGLAFVPADRKIRGIWGAMSAGDNVAMPQMTRLSRFGVRNRVREADVFNEVAKLTSLSPALYNLHAGSYSGGGQQKLLVGRWLAEGSNVEVILLDEPTQGIDVGARGDLYELLRSAARTRGLATVFTTSDPEEALLLADRVVVLYQGRIVLDRAAEELTEEQLLDAAHGGPDKDVA